MFNPHLSSLGYLHPNEEEGVFLQFPLSTREILAQQICFCLLNGMTSPIILSTNVHVQIVMECVGQSFSLPLNASKIIESCIELYRKWILDEKYRPAPIKEDEQFFLPEIIKQLSLVFVKRQCEEMAEFYKAESKSSSKVEMRQIDPVTVHVGLCNQVLDIYRAIGIQFQNTMLNYTWDVFLKIVLGVADSMLHEPSGSSPVTEILKPNILNLLFELWIRAPRTEEMWNKLTDLIRKWKHRKDTYTQWSSTLTAINNRMLRLLYGPSQGTESILFKQLNGDTISINLPAHEIPNTWYRMLHLLGHFEGSISNSENFLEAILGIEKVARSFIDLPTAQLSCKTVPDGNTILNICGGWLLEAINHYQSGFNKGKEVALDVLCSLIDSRPKCKFNPNYLAYFYKGIEKALNTRHVNIVSVILSKSTRFFQSDIEGSNILIPAFISSIERIILLEKSESAPELKQSATLADLQRASLRILAALFCLPNHYKSSQFTSNSSKLSFTSSKLPTLTTYNELHYHVNEMLYEAVNTITNVENLQLALIISSCYSFEVIDIPAQKSFVDRFINLLLDKLLIGRWDQKNIITSLIILSNLSTLFQQLPDSHIIAQRIVTKICRLIEFKFFSASSTTDGDDVITNGLSCILQWILIDQWIINDRECLNLFLEVIDFSLNHKSTEKQIVNENEKRQPEIEVSEKVKISAEYVFQLFLNYIGNFPLPTGPDSLSSLHTETELLESYGLSNKTLTSYVCENKIINMIRFPRENGTEILIIIRDGTAKYVWRSKLNYFIERVEAPPSVSSEDVNQTSTTQKIENLDVMLNQISTRLIPQEREAHDYLLKSINSLHSLEEMKLRMKNLRDDDNEILTMPTRMVPNIEEDLTVPRLFLTSWGINSLDNCAEFSQCHINSSKLRDELSTFSALDQSRIRGCYSATILYHTTNYGFIYGNCPKVSKEYTEFLSMIGWEVKIEDHKGYNSGLTPSICATAPYYADFQSELIFRVASKTSDIPQFQNLMHDNGIYITWVEDLSAFSSCEFHYTANIAIYPRPNSLYRIRIYLNRVDNYGPLLDEMVVSKQILAHTVRLTVLNLCRNLSGSLGKPLYLRKALIDLRKNEQQENQAYCFRKTQLSQFLP